MRVGFLFNHDQIHQVAHLLPVALALAGMDLGTEIVLAVTSARIEAEVRRLAGAGIDAGLTIRRLSLDSPVSRALAALAGPVVPAAKLLVYRDNLDFFRSLDVLVVAEKTSLILKTRYGLDRLRIVHTRHGAGDRAIGFDRKSADFDHVLVSGRKIRERLVAEAGVEPARISVVGYPKFDVCVAGSPARREDSRPVVLYNPHVSPHLSSWFKSGRAILDWFVDHPEYRLIFAPHVMLFERSFVVTIDRLRIDRPGSIGERVRRAENIEIDLGSRASTTMAYTDRADIYLGDASSQVYEFLRTPRPCVFFDSHRAAWRYDPNYAHWRAGPVIGDVAQLGDALERSRLDHEDRWRDVQRELFDYSFDLDDVPSSLRAARAVAEFAGLG